MHVVVKLGGCNGSGKTTLARAIMAELNMGPLARSHTGAVRSYGGPARVVPRPVLLGSYENVCGGMDTISDKYERLELVTHYAKAGHIVFYEGLITGKTYGAMGELSDARNQKGRWVYAFMDTPFEVCVQRVLKRRAAAGNEKEFDPQRTMAPTFRSCEATARRAKAEGHRVVMVSHKAKPSIAAKALIKIAQELYHAG